MHYSTPLTDEKNEAPSELPSYMIIQQKSFEAISSESLTPVISASLLDLVRDGQSWLQKRHLKGMGAKIMSGRWETQELEASSWRREEGEQGRWHRVSPPVPTPPQQPSTVTANGWPCLISQTAKSRPSGSPLDLFALSYLTSVGLVQLRSERLNWKGSLELHDATPRRTKRGLWIIRCLCSSL